MITLGNTLPGEVKLFRLLQLNPGLTIRAFCLAGADHYHRFHPETDSPDTIQRLEEGILRGHDGLNGKRHHISVLFLDRGNCEQGSETFLDVQGLFLQPSSISRIERIAP